MEKIRYCLRYAAGTYWLLDIGQPVGQGREPLRMNEMGADIIKLINSGYGQADVIRKLSEEYGVEEKLVAEDVTAFLQMLGTQGFEIVGEKGAVLL